MILTVRAIALYAFSPLNVANTHCMTLFPAIFTLQDSQIHVGSLYYSNEAFYVEASVDNFLSIGSTLGVPYINLNDGHIRLGRDFDNSRLRY